MKWIKRGSIPLIVVAGLIGGGYFLLRGIEIDVLTPAGSVASQQRDLFFLTIGLSALVVLPVFVLLIVFSFRYREGNDRAKYKPDFKENKVLETVWWGVPMLIIGVLAVATYVTSHSLDPYKAIESSRQPLEVQVVTLQWKWLFIYPEYSLATLNHMPVEVGRPVHFTLTADAPMSSFWIPKLGSQVYTMKGMQSELNLVADTVGEYKGYTTNINGEGYSDMVFTVRARSSGDFTKWLAAASEAPATLDAVTYKTLAQPNTITTERTFRLADPSLFSTIVHESMSTEDESGLHGAHHE
jgi:cytochrome o ubiquinol oxidase subunit 2